MNRRRFALTLPMALAGGRLTWAESARIASGAGPLHLAFRSAEYRGGDAYQQELRKAIDRLRALGYSVEAFDWGTDYAPLKGRLTGTCKVPAGYLPASFRPVMADWLRGHPARYVCAAIGEARAVACSPAEALTFRPSPSCTTRTGSANSRDRAAVASSARAV